MNPSSSSTWSDESRSFLTGDNALYIAQIYATYLEDPHAVTSEWRQYFSSLGDKESEVFKDIMGPSWAQRAYSQERREYLPLPAVPESADARRKDLSRRRKGGKLDKEEVVIVLILDSILLLIWLCAFAPSREIFSSLIGVIRRYLGHIAFPALLPLRMGLC